MRPSLGAAGSTAIAGDRRAPPLRLALSPRSLTQPIVAETLRPILGRLGPRATPEQVLELKVLDPAMGSGAFLVEACRQLAEALVRAWDAHGVRP